MFCIKKKKKKGSSQFATPWDARDGYVPPLWPCLVAIGCLWGSAAAGDLLAPAHFLHAPSPAMLLPTSASGFGCFFLFLISDCIWLCSVFNLA
jgi:hypothetical protein